MRDEFDTLKLLGRHRAIAGLVSAAFASALIVAAVVGTSRVNTLSIRSVASSRRINLSARSSTIADYVISISASRTCRFTSVINAICSFARL